MLLPLVAPELQALPAALARQRGPVGVQPLEQVRDRRDLERLAVVAELWPALLLPPVDHLQGAAERAPGLALGVVGPHPVDAELRRRLPAGLREAAPLLRVTEGTWPLQIHRVLWKESGNFLNTAVHYTDICTR